MFKNMTANRGQQYRYTVLSTGCKDYMIGKPGCSQRDREACLLVSWLECNTYSLCLECFSDSCQAEQTLHCLYILKITEWAE